MSSVLVSPRLISVEEAVHRGAAFAGGGGIARLYHEVLLHVVKQAAVVVPWRTQAVDTRGKGGYTRSFSYMKGVNRTSPQYRTPSESHGGCNTLA